MPSDILMTPKESRNEPEPLEIPKRDAHTPEQQYGLYADYLFHWECAEEPYEQADDESDREG
jgi:hypothetical protein